MKVGVKLSKNQIKSLQLLSFGHLVFSLTKQCPLKCAHCIVSSEQDSQDTGTLSYEQAQFFAAQLAELGAHHVRRVSFTGGEPVLSFRQLNIMSQAAVQAGMTCTVVTSGYFADSIQNAYKYIMDFPFIQNWHFSTDSYHECFVPRSNIINAVTAARCLGKNVIIRMTVEKPISSKNHEIYSYLKSKMPDVDFFIQPVINSGRAESIDKSLEYSLEPAGPCVTGGMVVRYDGTVSPCCSGLIEKRQGHPFIFQNVFDIGILSVYQSWLQHPVLKLIQAVGFAPLLMLLREGFSGIKMETGVPQHPCECCLWLWSHQGVSDYISSRLNSPQNREKINMVYEKLFGIRTIHECQNGGRHE
ncbi:MAG: radical SAM/SPASM domain-containing protein [Bacillota bacterium]|jgi:pyruvate-formate lyase-activating enzyme